MQQTTLVPTRRADGVRADLVCAAAAAVLVALAFAVPFIMGRAWSERLCAAAAPIFGIWGPHIGWGTGPAIVIAVLVLLTGPELARRLPWRPMLLLAWATSVAWTFSLAMIDGWRVGFAGQRLARHEEYLYEARRITDLGAMLRGFSGRILDFQPDSWATHVSGHPAGALLTFVLLDRIGLGSGAWAAWVVVLAGCSAAAAVPVALNALGSPERARAVVPFLILAPAAVWIGVSADALFTGVTAWAVALLAIATRRRAGWAGIALASGLLFGYGIYLNYGLTLVAVPAAAVLLMPGGRSLLPAVAALIGVALVVAAFTASGFWWLDGYHLVVQRYYQGIASERPYSYWVWGNLAATVCAVGLAAAAALHRVVREVVPGLPDRRLPWLPWLSRWRGEVDPAALLAVAGLAAIVAADLSGLSKAETERIWLPFDMWLLAGTALLPYRNVRAWLAVQAVAALAINHLLMTNW